MSDPKPINVLSSENSLTAAQRRTVYALCDLMIPASADGSMPAASSLDLYAASRPLPDDVHECFTVGLDALELRAQQQHGCAFADLAAEPAMAVVEEQRSPLRAFFGAFTLHTAARYYQDDEVMTKIGLEPRAPWPQGNAVESGDWSLLDPVRERAPFFRKV